MKTALSRKRAIPAFLLCLLLALGGCATTGGKSYTKDEARQMQTVQRGVIVSLEEVTIEQDAGIVGAGIGGVLGGVVGSTMGGGTGRLLTTAGGAAIGALLGAFGEKAVRTEKAYEFMIDLENNGGTISIVQAIDGQYAVGDHVRILRSSGNRARVVKGQ
jgi:outer membrane lipoprotein SlyB